MVSFSRGVYDEYIQEDTTPRDHKIKILDHPVNEINTHTHTHTPIPDTKNKSKNFFVHSLFFLNTPLFVKGHRRRIEIKGVEGTAVELVFVENNRPDTIPQGYRKTYHEDLES
jgi:hypothetical protein